ncbi:DNA repair protein UVH3 isoform X2 [Spinacia oleracea]|nr:DNA repair protein UVH3 isoform X2 [Spinacia oleracea]XP_021857449.2 DNA repair protein UVH3 isoform X2 [Spinacia oleracea]
MILPVTDGNVDPAVLAALPPSMQLDLLVQMRERLMAENRQKYQKVKKVPQKFSELQIEAYLKTVAFRREIDQVQKAAAGKDVGGIQTSRIASESNREFIFSSSFSGDKQLLASGEAEKIPKIQQTKEKKDSHFDILNAMASATKSSTESEPGIDEAVQTFIDEKGHRRVSSRRAMGIRMTRDLQRNIDLMKELEQERTTVNIEAKAQTNPDMGGQSMESHCNVKSVEGVNDFNCDIVQNSTVNSSLEPESHKDALKSESCIKITFDDDVKQRSFDGDDEFFSHLVVGDQVPLCSANNSSSDCEWEDGMISGERGSLINGNKLAASSFPAQDGNINDSDVEWEDGTTLMNDKCNSKFSDVEDINDEETGVKWQEELTITDIHEDARSLYSNLQTDISKGSAEEEAALQEAIRRSLEDSTGGKSSCVSYNLKADGCAFNRDLQLESCLPLPSSHLERVLDGHQLSQSSVNMYNQSNFLSEKNSCALSNLGMHSTSGAFVPVGPAPHIDTKNDLNEQQLSTSSENAQTSNLAGSGVPTDMAAGVPATLPENIVNDVTTERAFPSSNFDMAHGNLVGHTSSILEEKTLYGDLKTSVGKDDTCHLSDDVKTSAFKDKENTLEPLGINVEDELLVLDQEYKTLGDEQKRLERNADSVNAEMFVECQELLQMFGLPYIIAPMEAEAQCAYMELANLVDGVVTDDSDVFLFGAQCVYKNIFDDRKYVETYFMKDIENELGLNREKLIRMALLLGSDYTEGISGIGIVNAIEVLNAFPEEEGFHKFREWIESPDPAILGKVGVQSGSSSKKKGSKASKNRMSNSKSDMEGNSAADSCTLLEYDDDEARNDIQKMKLTFMNKHRNVSKNWHIPASFPSDAVISAYAAPQVDKSTEPFAWGKPDIFSLRRLCWEKFGWASQKADELLSPVLKEYNKHETQLRLEAFYTFNERFAKIRSKRIKQAVKGITGKQSSDLEKANDLQENPGKMEKKARASGNTRKKSVSKRKDHVVGVRNSSAKKLKSQQEKENKEEGLSTEVGSIGLCTEAEKQSKSDAGSSRVRGRGRRAAAGRGRRKENSDSECDETSIHDHKSSSDEHELLPENMELPDSVRRSKRARKTANYLEEDEESDELVIPLNRTNKNCSDDGASGPTLSPFLSVHEAGMANASGEIDLPGHGLPGDYLVAGGGFCAEEDEEEIECNQSSSVQKDTSTVDADSEYLQMGGGFCVDEEDDLHFQECDGGGAFTITDALAETKEHGLTIGPHESISVAASVTGTVQGLQKVPSSDSNLSSGDKLQNVDGNLSNAGVSTYIATPTSVNPFSALPYLKRKKKKP